ncbi:uncharacterized protein LAESUDRAFT_752112 [Laetiporus sulphureus 93-53]|uniref:CWH43-like N-terminal domain-containing protein n=1 Tax=Laetiporus sulphureus 93-53 TaxID=1314785 RepID=A0A165CDF4_9APHY|nr:uncharacterized protein LAESUDRAFT_752112 [Laetiporus sulphureus 93-53]KZT02611.1 hypothetical protein LAESUDRAFT_752112 [Laetiporus sulphureus 93-53]
MPWAYEHRYWLYAWIPIFGSFIWFFTLWAMLITWLATGRPKYVHEQGSIALISDIGASYLKPLFIACCSITGASFFLTLVTERWLRHSGRLIPNMRRREKVFSILAIIGSFIGGGGLIMLSIFDVRRFHSVHDSMLVVFIVGVGLSAIFIIIEYRWLSKNYAEERKLKTAYIIKGVIAGTLIILAIIFAITLWVASNVGAVFEWVIAFGYTFYLLSFYFDLRMSRGVRKGELHPLAAQRTGVPMQQVNGNNVNQPYTNGHTNGHGNGGVYGYAANGPAANMSERV